MFKKILLAGVLGVAGLTGASFTGLEATKVSAASVQDQDVFKYYSLSSYEVTPKESFYLKKGEELSVTVTNSGYPITYTVYDADNKVIGTYDTYAKYGRIFKATKDGNISVQFQAGVNSSFTKKMSFTAKFSLYKFAE
ncbi:F0F1 ATP synthase subunit alpha [Brevibacillus laterosporus]|nr:F0F1 ATP synthase subunit alpha [Brevibacillus laterosporus]